MCTAKGNLKIKDKKLITGDHVVFENGVITEICERKSVTFRPKVANVDVVNIVIAEKPVPDYLLIDKMIAQCVKLGISVYITVNKSDLSDDTANYVLANYKEAVDKIFIVSAQTGAGIVELTDSLENKLCCLAGQSAVGKTSLCNCIFNKSETVNTLSEKTERGRHTTTSRIIHYTDKLLVVDTPGFSSFDLNDTDSYYLMNYYKDFEPYNKKCYYIGCTHISEPDCCLKQAVCDDQVSQDRYNRYIAIFKELKDYEKRKY